METTRDGFLGGRLTIRQPRKGYRAGVDPVLLAASVPAVVGETVLDLGCGVGTAALCLARRTGATVVGVEVQPGYAALARANGEENAIDFTVHEADITALPEALKAQSFDHVIVNPPYFAEALGTRAADEGRARAFSDALPLAVWADAALRRLRPGGRLTLIQRIERLPEVLSAIDGRAGALRVLPIMGRVGRPPDRFLLTARKGARGPFVMESPFIMHLGAAHTQDRPDYTPTADAILRDAAALEWAPTDAD